MASSLTTTNANARTSQVNGSQLNNLNKSPVTHFQAQEATYTAPEPKNAPEPPKTAQNSGSCAELTERLLGLGVAQSDIQYAIFIANKESGCKSSSVNKSSGACGEFQSLPCGKWGAPGTDQYLLKAIQYAQNRYSGWQGAYTAWITKHWW